MPVVHTGRRQVRRRCSRCRRRSSRPHGFQNDPVLGLVEQPRARTATCSHVVQGLRRHPRGDDPLHRDERRRDRRVADHVRDGRLPAAAARLPQAASALQDAVAVARRLRGIAPMLLAALRARRRSSARCTRSARCSRSRSRTCRVDRHPREAAGPRRAARVPRAAEPPVARESTGRCSRSSAGSAPGCRGSSSSSSRRHPVRGARLARDRVRLLRALPAPDPACAARARPSARRSQIGPAVALEYRSILVPVAAGYPSDEAMDVACRLAAERRATIVAMTVIEVPLAPAARRAAAGRGGRGERAARRGAARSASRTAST